MEQSELNISDLELSELIEAIYQAPFKNDWSKVFNQIMDHTYSNKVFWYFADVKHQQILTSEFSMKMPAPANIIKDFFSRPQEDPYYLIAKDMVEGEALFLNELVDISQYKESEFYQNILVPMDSGQAIGSAINRDAEFEALFAINRGFNDSKYSKQDINLVSMLTPHLGRAMHIFRELELYKGYASMNKSIIDQANKGILVCDAQGCILMANAFTEEVFSQVPELSEQDGKLVCHDNKIHTQLAQLIYDHAGISLQNIKAQNTLIISSQSNQDVVIEISPLSINSELNTFNQACCLLSVKLQNSMTWQIDVVKQFVTPQLSHLSP